MPLGCIYVQPSLCQGHWCTPYTNGNFGHSKVVSIPTAWGFDVARFDKQGNSYEPQNVERATVQGFTLSLCLLVMD